MQQTEPQEEILCHLEVQAWLNDQKAKTKDNFVAKIPYQINVVQSENDWWVDRVLPSMCVRTTPSSRLLTWLKMEKCFT